MPATRARFCMRWLTWRGVNPITRSAPAGAVLLRSSSPARGRPGADTPDTRRGSHRRAAGRRSSCSGRTSTGRYWFRWPRRLLAPLPCCGCWADPAGSAGHPPPRQVRAASRYVLPTIRSWVSTTASARNSSHSTAQTARIARRRLSGSSRTLFVLNNSSTLPPSNAVADGCDGHSFVTAPHDLVSGGRVAFGSGSRRGWRAGGLRRRDGQGGGRPSSSA